MAQKEELLQWHDACQMFESRDYKQALMLLRPIADMSKIHFNMAMAFINLQNEDQAINSLTKAIECDSYSTVAHYVRGILFFKKELFSEALADFADALQSMRSSLIIDYTQLGLDLKIYYYEIAFNRGLCFSAIGNMDGAISDFDDADRSHPTSLGAGDRTYLEEKIDQAVDLGERAAEYVSMYELDYGKCIYKPNAEKVVAGVNERDAFAGFSGTLVKSEKQLINKGPMEDGIQFQTDMQRKKTLTDMSVESRRTEKAQAERAATLSRMRVGSGATGGGKPNPSLKSGRSGNNPKIQSRTSSLLLDDLDVSAMNLRRGSR
ncbi:hypothetical protein HDU98_007019 [Podochytrium sp. JEL0797]|nr:hypothetical protein HDU98_007019 [Podochytrium sp. JEL0797]